MLYHISKYGHHHVAVSHLFWAVALQSLQHVLETCLEAPYGEALFGHKEDGERTLAIIKRSKDYDALNVELKIIHLMYIHLLVCMLILWNAFIQLNVFMGCTYFSPLCAWVKCAVGLAHPVPCDEPLRLAELNVLCTSIVAMLHFSDFRSRSQLVVLKRHESNKFEVCNRILEALTSLHWTSLNKVDSCKTSMPAPAKVGLALGPFTGTIGDKFGLQDPCLHFSWAAVCVCNKSQPIKSTSLNIWHFSRRERLLMA